MDKNDNNWAENTDDIAEIKKKIKNEFNGEDHIDDLRDSLASTLENTREIFNNLTTTIDSTIKDEDIRYYPNIKTSKAYSLLQDFYLS